MTRIRILPCALIASFLSLSVSRDARAQEPTETPMATPTATPEMTPPPAPEMTATPVTTPVASPAMATAESPARTRKHKPDERENVVFLNPFLLLIRTVSGGIEHKVSPNMTIAIGGHVIDYPGFESGTEDAHLRGYGAYLQPHVYFGRRGAPRGPYLAPFVSGERLEFGFDTREDVAALRYGAGSTIGWSWLPWNRLNIKLGIGAGYYFNSTTEDPEVTDVSEGVDLTGDLKFGWAF